jgi:hypothetical protein
MGFVSRVLAVVVMGVALFFLTALPLTTAFVAASGPSGPSVVAAFAPVFGVSVVTIVVAVTAPTARIAWGRLFLFGGLAGFALPFQGALVSAAVGSAIGAGASGAPGAAAGLVLGGAVMTGVAAFFGLFVGLIFVVAAYFILRGAPRPLLRPA